MSETERREELKRAMAAVDRQIRGDGALHYGKDREEFERRLKARKEQADAGSK